MAYPSEETLSNGQSFVYLPTQSSQLMDSLWLEVKTDGSNPMVYLVAALIVVAVVVVLAVVLQSRKKKKQARRGKA